MIKVHPVTPARPIRVEVGLVQALDPSGIERTRSPYRSGNDVLQLRNPKDHRDLPPFPTARDHGLEVRQQLLENQVLVATENEKHGTQLLGTPAAKLPATVIPAAWPC